jgi:hypothetical protein
MLGTVKGCALLRSASPLRVTALARGAVLKLSGRGTSERSPPRGVEQGTCSDLMLTSKVISSEYQKDI